MQGKRMVQAYFISDAHLGAEDDTNEEKKKELLTKFLNHIKGRATHLFIVGDFFDFWFEYGTVIPKKCFSFLTQFQELRRAGVEIHYLAGNHDFALGSFFTEVLDIRVHEDELKLNLAGKRFYLYHGDGVAKRDVGYRILKRILRNPVNQKIFRWLHPDLGIKLAKTMSGSSRKYTTLKNAPEIERDYDAFAETRFAEGFDYVLMGHRHFPRRYEKDGHVYINLGDWMVHYTYAVFDGQSLELKSFTPEN